MVIFHVSNVCNKYPFQLSGGQQQRIMIAIAIACNPKILIADEPTTSIDSATKNEIINLLKEIQKKTKMSIIFVSHDLSLVSKFTNKISTLVLVDRKHHNFPIKTNYVGIEVSTTLRQFIEVDLEANKGAYLF